MPAPTWKPSASGPRCAIAEVIAVKRSRSIGRAASKLNLPAMPHMSGGCQLGFRSGNDPAARQFGQIQLVEGVHHPIEGVACAGLRARRVAKMDCRLRVSED